MAEQVFLYPCPNAIMLDPIGSNRLENTVFQCTAPLRKLSTADPWILTPVHPQVQLFADFPPIFIYLINYLLGGSLLGTNPYFLCKMPTGSLWRFFGGLNHFNGLKWTSVICGFCLQILGVHRIVNMSKEIRYISISLSPDPPLLKKQAFQIRRMQVFETSKFRPNSKMTEFIFLAPLWNTEPLMETYNLIKTTL